MTTLKATVPFNGHRYIGEVVEEYGSRVAVRFATGGGKTRERRFAVTTELDMVRAGFAFIHHDGDTSKSGGKEFPLCEHVNSVERLSTHFAGASIARPSRRRFCKDCGEALDKQWKLAADLADARHAPSLEVKHVELIDGLGKVPARMIAGPYVVCPADGCSWGCCAHHGEGPNFPCCRCGAVYREADAPAA